MNSAGVTYRVLEREVHASFTDAVAVGRLLGAARTRKGGWHMTLDLRYPRDEPGTIQGVTQTLDAVAGGLDGAQQRLVGHGSGLRGVWRDQAGAAAAAETDALGRIVHTGAQGMRQASGALRTYHGAITSARE